MATCREIETVALQILEVVNEGVPDAPAYHLEVAHRALKGIYTSYIAAGIFGPLTNVAVEEDYEAGENERIADVSSSSVVITLPVTVEDVDPDTGATVARAPYDRSVVQIAGGDSFIYDANAGAWSQIGTLEHDDYAPLSTLFEEGVSALLAVRISPIYKVAVAQQTEQLAAATRAAFRRKPPIVVPVASPLLRTIGRGCR